MVIDPNNLGNLNQLQAAQLLAQSSALNNTLAQRFATQDQVLQRIRNLPPPTNFLGDIGTEFVDQASFNTLDRPSGGGVGSMIGRAGGGIANALTLTGLLGLTPLAPEVTVPLGLGLAGALGGGSLEARQQINQSGQITDPGAVIGQGVIEGGLNLIPGSKAASFARRALQDVPVMAGAGLAGDAVSQAVKGQPFNAGEAGAATGMGAGMGVVSALLGGPRTVNTPDQLWRGPNDIPPQSGIPDAGVMTEARARVNQNLMPSRLPDNVTVDPRLYARPELEAIDNQLQALLGKSEPATVDALPAVRDLEAALPTQAVETPKVPKPGANGYIDSTTINAPIQQAFESRGAAMRGARQLGLKPSQVQPVQTGKGEWMVHVKEPEAPKVTPETPLVVAENSPAVKSGEAPQIVNEPPVTTQPQLPQTAREMDFSQVQPGETVLGGKFQGLDNLSRPVIARKGGVKRPGESGTASTVQEVEFIIQQAPELADPATVQAMQRILQDVEAGKATEFTVNSKVGRSSQLAESVMADSPPIALDKVSHIEIKPATAKTPAQIRLAVINSEGKPAYRILKEDGNPALGLEVKGTREPLDVHSPERIDPTSRELVADPLIQQAGMVRKAAQGTKHEANPIVKRLDDAIRGNDSKTLQQAIRDIDRLPPEIKKELGIQSGCIKKG